MAFLLEIFLLLSVAGNAWSQSSLVRRDDVPQFVKDYGKWRVFNLSTRLQGLSGFCSLSKLSKYVQLL